MEKPGCDSAGTRSLKIFCSLVQNADRSTWSASGTVLCSAAQKYKREWLFRGGRFEAKGYHALFGKTQGYFGPYIWRDTVPTVYPVELPDGTAEYTVNILKGFVFRSWMDYLTFGQFGTGGWSSPDGTINCIAQAYDFESERFRISLLKHEAQHTVDRKRFPGITSAELEDRAKLVELHYSGNLGLLQKFLSEADESRQNDGHALASARLKGQFSDTDQGVISCIQARALELLHTHTKEMEEKYGNHFV